ncbi:MAG: insulinase family protein, partial [Acidobacteriota bacterium]
MTHLPDTPLRAPVPHPIRTVATLLLIPAIVGVLACAPVDKAVLRDGVTPPVVEVQAPLVDGPATAPPSKPDTVAAQGFEPETAPLDATIPISEQIRVGTLDNGLRYLIRRNAKPEQRAELRLAINAGSMQEDDDQLGLAHFVEHMLFNGTENFEKAELVDYLQSIGMRFGADINAYTAFEETVYFLTVPTDDAEVLAKAFLVLGDWAGRASFDGEEIDKERGVIVAEWRRGQGAGSRVRDQQLPVLFKDSRYAERLPIGTKESVETAPHDNLRRFYRDWYRPDLMAVVAVGDFDVDAIEGLIRANFESLENPEAARERKAFPVPPHDETLVSTVTDPELTATQVSVVFKHGPEPEGTVGAYRRGLVATLYNTMFNARLVELAQEADPPFVWAVSGDAALTRTVGTYQLDAQVSDGEVEQGLRVLLTEVERVDRHGFTESELERAKAETLRFYTQALKEADKAPSAGFAAEYVRHFLAGEPIPGIEAETAFARRFVPEIDLDEVNALGQGWISDRNRVILVSGPEGEGLELPSESAILAVFDDATSAPGIEPWVDETRDEPLLADSPTPSPVVDERLLDALGITEWRLGNGVRVVLKPTDFQNDQVTLSAWSPGGHSLVSAEQLDSATFATFILGQSGLGDFSASELQKALAGKVAAVNPFITELEEGLAGFGSPDDLETLFQLTYLTFTAPRLEDEAYRNFLTRMGTVVEHRSQNPQTVYADEWTRRLFQDHPRRQPLTAESLQRVDGKAAMEIYRDRFADASDFTFLLVGNFDTEAVRPLVETYLGGLPNLGRDETWRDVGVRRPDGQLRFEVAKGLEPTSQVRILYHGLSEWSRDQVFLLDSLAMALRIHLVEVLREELGATYSVGVDSNLSARPVERYGVAVQFGSDPDEADGLVARVSEEIERLKVDGFPPELADKVREIRRREREVAERENDFWVAVLRTY